MKTRAGDNGKDNMGRQATAPRGASRIAPPKVPTQRQRQAPKINWQLTGRILGLCVVVVVIARVVQLWPVVEPQLDRSIAQIL